MILNFMWTLCPEKLLNSHAAAAQLCPALRDPIDGIGGSPPGSSVPGRLQARTLEWVAISFSNAPMHAKSLQSCPTLCDPMERAHQVPLSIGFSRQEYWSGCHFLLLNSHTSNNFLLDYLGFWNLLIMSAAETILTYSLDIVSFSLSCPIALGPGMSK